jgi:hypothetical protein
LSEHLRRSLTVIVRVQNIRMKYHVRELYEVWPTQLCVHERIKRVAKSERKIRKIEGLRIRSLMIFPQMQNHFIRYTHLFLHCGISSGFAGRGTMGFEPGPFPGLGSRTSGGFTPPNSLAITGYDFFGWLTIIIAICAAKSSRRATS